jgi:serine/threonine protein kinase
MIGTTLGPYRVVSKLGAGGMGEVYRALDRKLNRDVALKILPDAFASDPDRLARFKREAQVLASLNDPHIGAIYGFEDSGSVHALVLELVEGPTLADRIAAGPIPLDQALTIARQLAEALEAAHDQNIVHRDLKPANIKVRDDGTVKVLDFGLAKALEPATGMRVDVTNSPTITTPARMTGVGTILGTAAYMSPEQAKGREADKRSDIWAFGAVFYEMLTGKRPFDAEDVSSTLAKVIEREPDWTRLPPDAPAAVTRLLGRCLEKDPRRRLRDISDLRFDIEEAANRSRVPVPAALGRSRPQRYREWIASAIAAVGIVAAAAVLVRDINRPAPLETMLQVVTPPTSDAVSMAVSPDGRKLVFVGSNQGRSQLFLRPLDSVVAEPILGTEFASYPFWSPDSRVVGFFAEGKLKRVNVPGGAVQVIAPAPIGLGGTWSRDDVILFSRSASSGLVRMSAGGGMMTEVTHVESPRAPYHAFPQFLPDGRHFLFFVPVGSSAPGVYVGDLSSTAPAPLTESDSPAVYAPTGHILFIRQDTLFAQRFDTASRRLVGDAFPVAEHPARDGSWFVGAMSAGTGALVYRTGGSGNRLLTWFDRSGKRVGEIGSPDTTAPLDPELSPDGSRVALDRASPNRDVWVLEPGGINRRFTFDPAIDFAPVWSPDGSRIVFSSGRKGPVNLYVKSSTGAGNETQLLDIPAATVPLDWSRDGRFIVYRVVDPKNGNDLWILPLSGDNKPRPFATTPFNEANAQFSPDGRWIAYQSDESGQYQIYVQPFPGPGGKWQVSNAGGTQPRWNRNGKELFYIATDNRLMSVSVETTQSGEAVKAAPPVALFAASIVEVPPTTQRQQYAVSPDGTRFLVNVLAESAAVSPITVVLNWNPGPTK